MEPKLIIRYTIAAIVLLFLQCPPAMSSLVYTEADGLLLYYPDSEAPIASRLLDKFQPDKNFLEQHGLNLTFPLHVILDDELDQPGPQVTMIPHREIRIPLRAPGVLEDGYLENDPWAYFLFKGLCLQGIYSERSGFPGAAYKVFGESMSPNKVLPQWIKTGICQLLYGLYTGDRSQDFYHDALFETTMLPDIDDVSHRPEKWPGQYSYHIFGTPFINWIYDRYGWERILAFIQLHGKGLIPFEIDLKAREIFGSSYTELWEKFRREFDRQEPSEEGLNITGYWPDPFVFWNLRGIYPGLERIRLRGRYGYVRDDDAVRLSEYDHLGRARLYEYHSTTPLVFGINHIWDPGPGEIAAGRQGSRPGLVQLPQNSNLWLEQFYRKIKADITFIPAPSGALGISGPVKAADGRIAVAVNVQGNWDIWVYDGQWHRVTTGSSLEMDPWWQDDRLVFASNVSGRFQIHAADMRPLTDCPSVAVMPRQNTFLCLTPTGWQTQNYQPDQLPDVLPLAAHSVPADEGSKSEGLESKPYTPMKSIWPNYFRPDGFIGSNDIQLGFATKSRDVSKRYRLDAGARYSFDHDYISVVLGGNAENFGLRFNRYPISYDPERTEPIDQSRHEVRISWQPFGIKELEISANGQWYEQLNGEGETGDDYWGAASWKQTFGRHRGWINLDVFGDDSRSLFGGFNLLFGEKIYSSIHFLGGKTWGDINPGHNTFRIGGNLTEGYFTQRPTRLFPLRGFNANILEAPEAITGGFEVYWPLANLQQGYKTLPVFFASSAHRHIYRCRCSC